jgi:hypothetical protein
MLSTPFKTWCALYAAIRSPLPLSPSPPEDVGYIIAQESEDGLGLDLVSGLGDIGIDTAKVCLRLYKRTNIFLLAGVHCNIYMHAYL